MKAREATFGEVVGPNRQFRVPLYQRHYRWKTEQQQELWLDLLEQYRALRDGAPSNIPRHFIGSIVAVEFDPDPVRDLRNFRIVDGQQRITTLLLAITALRDIAAEDDPDAFRRLTARYLVNDTEPSQTEYWARLKPGDEDESAFWTVLTNPSEADGHTSVGAAYSLFRGEIERLRDEGELEPGTLATAIGDRLSVVFITVQEGERPHKIFESINATGVELSEADLLRNYLFMALGERSNTVYAQHWRPLEKVVGADSLEGLVRDDLQCAGTFVRRDRVYRTHREQLEKVAGDLDALEERVKRLARRGGHYRHFLRPHAAEVGELTKDEKSHLLFLRQWGATTTWPFLLFVYDRVDVGEATSEQAIRCLEFLESFIVRRHLVAVPTRALNRLFIGLIGQLPQGEPLDEAVHRELSRDGRWPDDEQVRLGVRTVPFYEYGRGNQQKAILQRLESQLRAEVGVDFDAADLTIEHIMPQTLSADWRDRLKADGYDPDTVFREAGHTLGNLTLTAFNGTLSNHVIERKQEILQDSELRLNDPLKEVQAWSSPEITERAEWLGDQAVEIWIPPIPGVVTPHTGFDWSRVDAAVEALGPGRWTSYGDLAELVGTAPQPSATHVADSGLPHAYRVLSGDGSVSPNFRWVDPSDTRDPLVVLTGEGIEFDEQGRASQAQRLSASELEALLADEPPD